MPFLGSVTPDHIPVPQEEGKGDKGGRDGQSKTKRVEDGKGKRC